MRFRQSAHVEVYKMPETPNDVCQLLKEACRGSGGVDHVRVYMEQVSGYAGGPGQPGSAMFNFGRGVGIIEGFLYGAGISFVLVRPQQWQKPLGIGNRGPLLKAAQYATKEERSAISAHNNRIRNEWKNKLKEVAQRLYPNRKVTLATCDSLLILEHARRQERMTPVEQPQREMAL